MKAYGVARLRNVHLGPAIVEYLEKIDATLAPFGGTFIIHGDRPTKVEGDWAGDLIVIEFPNRQAAVDWYESPAYQAILKLRTENSDSDVIIVDGVDETHKATDVLQG
ncbi:DUF1330 domain-containing protein [Tenggerimyces flavus]|uniref:DUF1330 domain-containing protein n=1 Tax=Tenggerimyces flavus TaxID=1708749 RepID=A0ABV7Y3T2_9ACTN|nr:DUF1330 domain-containing protein [Tenggerimyces flavus]MBM7788514.1 uncharacterized protein (DUF1330 family) [Tenggerimyces flavus]